LQKFAILVDVLDGLERIEVCTAYRCGSRTLTEFPSDVAQLSACEPIYESLPGWSTPTRGVRRFSDLPENARRYVAALEEHAGVPIILVSVGPERTQTIERAFRPMRWRPTLAGPPGAAPAAMLHP